MSAPAFFVLLCGPNNCRSPHALVRLMRVVGFFALLRVTNLDGLINSPIIYRHMPKNITRDVYVLQEGIEYIIDYAPDGLWPVGELGRPHYLDYYAEGSATFVMDTCALRRPACFEETGLGTSWLLTIRRRDGDFQWWIGTVWHVEGYRPARWRIVSDTGQVLAGPSEVTDTWPPGVPQPPREPKAIFDYRPLPDAAYGRRVTVQYTDSAGEWIHGTRIDVPNTPWLFAP